jgi:hypothetical protein
MLCLLMRVGWNVVRSASRHGKEGAALMSDTLKKFGIGASARKADYTADAAYYREPTEAELKQLADTRTGCD